MAILARVENHPDSGYGLTVCFMKRFGVILSSSTVYSTLYALERNGLVKCRQRWRGRVYELTEKGKDILKDGRNKLKMVPSFIETLIGK